MSDANSQPATANFSGLSGSGTQGTAMMGGNGARKANN